MRNIGVYIKGLVRFILQCFSLEIWKHLPGIVVFYYDFN